MEHDWYLPCLRLPGEDNLLKRGCLFTGFDEMPAPVIQPGNMPAAFNAIIKQKYFTQEVANPPIINLRMVGLLN
jgi:hypothetical protein